MMLENQQATEISISVARRSHLSVLFSVMSVLLLGSALLSCDDSEEITPTCPPNYIYCDGYCFELLNDRNHCGGCGQVCASDEACVQGSCTGTEEPPPQCMAPLSLCGDQCVNAQSDVMNCGVCGGVCQAGQLCVGGVCSTVMEACNGEDDDGDGRVDEGEGGGILKRSCSNLCGEGEEVCSSGAFVNCSAPEAELEVCDTLDNDCDGVVDEGTTSTFFQDADGDNYGSPELALAVEACSKPQGYSQRADDCNDADREVNPAALEVCDSQDNNCDQTIDEGCQCADGEIVSCGSDLGICSPGTQICQLGQLGNCGGSGYVAPEMEICDDLDNDCDGQTDEDQMSDPRENGSNGTCSSAHLLSPVDDGDSLRIQNVNLYSAPGMGPDVDWYTVLAREANDELDFSNVECINDQRQCYAMTLELTPPEGMPPEDIVACLQIGEVGNSCSSNGVRICTNESNVTFNAEQNAYLIGIKWPGVCVISDDSREFSVEVRGRDGNVNSCRNYGLKLTHVRLSPSECPTE